MLNVFSLQNSETRHYYYVQDCAFSISKNEVRLSFSHPVSMCGGQAQNVRVRNQIFWVEDEP